MSKIEGVIFDWAGTTVDFGCFAPVEVFLRIFRESGVEVTMAEARAPMGMLKRDHIRAMLEMPRIRNLWTEKKGRPYGETDIEDLYALFEPMLLASLDRFTEPLPGVVETVKELKKTGLKIGSTTGYTDSMMRILTVGAKEKGYEPDFWITPDSTGSCGRPYPYMIFRNMEALRLTAPWTVVKVGDTVADIREGIQAGEWSIGAVVGSSQLGLSQAEFLGLSAEEKASAIQAAENAFLDEDADFTIKTMSDLPVMIERINSLVQAGVKPGAR
jgi:phosphonoacetaldehyde hydrolase